MKSIRFLTESCDCPAGLLPEANAPSALSIHFPEVFAFLPEMPAAYSVPGKESFLPPPDAAKSMDTPLSLRHILFPKIAGLQALRLKITFAQRASRLYHI